MVATVTNSKPRTPSKKGSALQLLCTVNREAFLRALKPVAGFLPTKPVSKMAGCVLVELASMLTVAAARSRETASKSILTTRGEAQKAGQSCVNGRRLLEIVNGMKSDEVELTASMDSLQISSANAGTSASFELDAMNPDEFIGNFIKNEPVVFYGIVSAARLRLALNRVVWCSEFHKEHPFCDGVLFDFVAGELVLAGTNTRLIAAAKVGPLMMPNRHRPEDPDRIIVLPKSSVFELLELLPDGTDDVVSLSASRGWLDISMETEVGRMGARFNLIDHMFPNYTKIIPPRNPGRAVTANGNYLARQMRLMRPFVENGFRLEFTPVPGQATGDVQNARCRAHAIRADIGEATDEIPVYMRAGMTTGKIWVVPKQMETVATLIGDDVFSIFVPEDAETAIRIEAGEDWVVCMAQSSEEK